MENNKEKNLKDLENFFDIDMKIKQAIIDLAPNEDYRYNSDYLIEYSDKINSYFNEIEYYINKLTQSFDLNIYQEGIKEKMKQIKERIQNSGSKFNNLKQIYTSCFTNMNNSIIENAKQNIYGYSINNDISGLINESKSINELLHVLHTYITNNDEILTSLPLLKRNGQENVSLYGEKNNIAEDIFNTLKNVDEGFSSSVDIVSLKDRILMMARDRGHALSISIDMNEGASLVTYLVPKICNVDKVNKLRGVHKVRQNADIRTATSGMFEIRDIDNISKEIFDFIQSVPMDNDIKDIHNYQNEFETELIIPEKKGTVISWLKKKIENIKKKLLKKQKTTKIEEGQKYKDEKDNFKDRLNGSGEYNSANYQVNNKEKVEKQNDKIIGDDRSL